MLSRLGKKNKTLIVTISALFTLQASFSSTALAGDTLPYTGSSATGLNQPTQHGYTANDILEWEPETDKDAEMLRSRVPLQERNQAFAATQANPALSPDTQMFNLAGDYGNAFMDSTAYTNKFGQYTFPYWQYVDYYSYWHGMASAHVPTDLYNPSLPWYERWFEFGVLNIPNPAYTNAAHKNGVKSLGVIFFSSNDRGPQTYTQMLVKDKDGNFPVAEKLIEIAQYYGFDGYFFNQEESSGVAVKDIPTYKEFLKVMRESGLYVQWYDSVHNTTGRTRYENEFTAVNSPFVKDPQYGDLAHSIFLNYLWGKEKMVNSKAHAESLGLNPLETVFAGVEAGGDRFNKHRNDLRNNLDSNGKPMNSIALLGADFTHHGLDEDLGGEDTMRRSNSDYQWMSFIRDRAWWTGPNLDPTNTGRNPNASLSDVAAKGENWDGVAAYIAERSVIQGSNFVSNFNLGRGLAYYVNGKVSNSEEWSNINIQDIPVTWQWWMETSGTPLQTDFDFGPTYNAGQRYDYKKVGAYTGGNSLVVNGTLDAENFLRLYKTDLQVEEGSKFSITYNKTSQDDSSVMSIGLIFKDNPEKVVKVEVPQSGKKTDGWNTANLDLSKYSGNEIAAFGIVFDNGDEEKIENYQVNIGQVKVSDGSIEKPKAPTGLQITKALRDSNEMYISWNLNDYDDVKQYNVYNNGAYVGGIYDEVFYIKNLKGLSGEITVTAVSQDSQESDPAVVPYDLTKGAHNIKANQSDNGDMVVSWENPKDVHGKITVDISTEYDYAKEVSKTITVDSGNTEAKLPKMPINGDKYHLKIKIGNHDWVSYRGTFIDRTIEAYTAEKVTIKGTSVTWELPEARDWHYLYVYENGEAKTFNTTYSQGRKPYIVRGRTHLNELTFQTKSTDSILEFVIEDYSGNKASTVVRITIDDLYGVINGLVEKEELTVSAGERLTDTLMTANQHYDGGRVKQALTHLEKFKEEIDRNQLKDVSEDTKNMLKASADYLLRTWSN
ncbi:endo-beta-N-acetylglucosaminidase [Mesobacillus foraminis]|uniref:Endo-beta-N-acetylglucosaminidase D n=1 Tax=Mesobacillus foraminis TaxID=279826 RepID=A0A4R2BK21_9BACI|nr:endo-beta-N-acetylglucosaminidase [Mesobacillus foraminis]TCN27501.1 endo-beta-N-acetylglucosaminidase D [Mesobacillus foraminis]